MIGIKAIKEKIKENLPVSQKTAMDLIEKATERGFTEGVKWVNNQTSIELAGRENVNRSEWGNQMVSSGFCESANIGLKEADKIDTEKREYFTPIITESKKHIWKRNGYFNAQETDVFSNREQTPSDLITAQDAMYSATFNDPHAKALLMNITNYIIGGGLRFSVPNLKVQQYLEEFWRQNQLGLKQTSMIFSTLQMGEYFMGMFVEPLRTDKFKGDVTLRKFRTYEIPEIEVGKKDRDCYLSYEYIPAGSFYTKSEIDYLADYRYFTQFNNNKVNRQISQYHNQLDENKLMMFMRYNFGDEVRGRVPFAGALKYLRMGRDFLFDRFLLNHERGRILYIQKVPRINRTRADEYKPTPYSTTTDLPYGKILRISEGEEIDVVKANIDAADALPDYLNIMYMAAAEAQVPLIIIDQRASEEVYASMKRSANPFHQMIEAQRTFFGYYFGELFRFVIERGVDAGRLPDSVKIQIYEPYSSEKKPSSTSDRIDTKLIPIEIIWPDVFTEDPLSQARADALMIDRGVVSPETVANRQGLDYAEEVVKIKQYQDSGILPPSKEGKDKDKGNGKVSRVGLSEYETSIADGIEEISQKLDNLEKVKKGK